MARNRHGARARNSSSKRSTTIRIKRGGKHYVYALWKKN
nr:MAG TPA: hypothetical protein [Caudoviricetes sp.]